jgi:uncharacterized protein (DUF433 family)
MNKPDRVKILPAYSLAEAARLVGSKPSTLGAWFRGREYEAGGTKKKSHPVLPTQSEKGQPISFIDLIEAHVFQLIRKQYRIPMRKINAASDYLASIKGSLTFLAHQDFYLDSTNLILKIDTKMVSLSERGQLVDKDILESGLKQLSYGSDGYASEFYPRHGDVLQTSFVVSPTINFGRLCIARSGVGADIIAGRFIQGERISDIAADYGTTVDEIEEAIRWHERLRPSERIAA